MSSKPWVVKTPSGEIWGKIHRVIIDAASQQIVSVDVIRGDEGQCIRLPWRSLEVENEDIVLGMSEEQVQTTLRPSALA